MLQHAALYPGYKFKPVRKADKMKLSEEKKREKEAVRREKELQRSGGRESIYPPTGKLSLTTSLSLPFRALWFIIFIHTSGRRPRTRTRLSPNTPYSVTPDGTRPMARSLTYSGHSSSNEAAPDSRTASIFGAGRSQQSIGWGVKV
jgi:hypothetical protein